MKNSTAYFGNFNFSNGGNTTGKKNIGTLINSLKHSLRIKKTIDGKIIKDNSSKSYDPDTIKENIYVYNEEEFHIEKEDSDIAHEVLIKIMQDIEKNIEATKSEDEAKLKNKKHQLTMKLKNKFGEKGLDIILNNFNKNISAKKIHDYLIDKLPKDKKPKFEKPGIQQIQNYIDLLKNPPKQEYRNETLIKEIIFKLPDHNNIKNLDSKTLKAIHDNIANKMYKGHQVALNCIHNDEGNNHIQSMLHGYNHITKSFDIIKTEHNYLVENYFEEMIEEMKKDNETKTKIDISKLTPKNILKYKQDPLILKTLGEFKQKAFRDLTNEIFIDSDINIKKKTYPSKEAEDKFNEQMKADTILKEKGMSPYRRDIKEAEVKLEKLTAKSKTIENTIIENNQRLNNQEKILKTEEEKTNFIKNLSKEKVIPVAVVEKVIEELKTAKEWAKIEKIKYKKLLDNATNKEDKEKYIKLNDKYYKLESKADRLIKIKNPHKEDSTPQQEKSKTIYNEDTIKTDIKL